jgi:orotate phosphoribosyltransferase
VTSEELLKLFQECGALLQGHFRLSSGLHSEHYLQCARVLEDPARAERLGRLLADHWREHRVERVVAPALGGILVGHEVARALGVPFCFFERADGNFALRRGFGLSKGGRVLAVEDVITTGGSTQEVLQAVGCEGGVPVGVTSLVDRSGGIDFGLPCFSLLPFAPPVYEAASCPLCQKAVPLETPGSRYLVGKV